MSKTNFRPLPLTGTKQDRRLWVQPKKARQLLERAIAARFNALLLGDRGSGVTSLLNLLGTEQEDAGQRVAWVRLSESDDPAAIVDSVSRAISDDDFVPARQLRDALARLQTLAVDAGDTLVIIDGIAGRPGHDVFGRMRDELWELELQWLVGTSSEQASVLLTPPADAFFETVVHLEPLNDKEIISLLARRDRAGELGEALYARIAAASEGNPGQALALARHLLLLDPRERTQALRGDPVEAVREQLGEPAARLFSELLLRGPSGPSDEQLRARLGWSRPRAHQVFQSLENAGLATSNPEHSGRAGRPRKIYEAVQQ